MRNIRDEKERMGEKRQGTKDKEYKRQKRNNGRQRTRNIEDERERMKDKRQGI